MVILGILVLIGAIVFVTKLYCADDPGSTRSEPPKQTMHQTHTVPPRPTAQPPAAIASKPIPQAPVPSVPATKPALTPKPVNSNQTPVSSANFSDAHYQILSDLMLLKYLSSCGVQYIDNRDKHGALWIIGGREMSALVDVCKIHYGVTFTFKPDGAQCAGYKPAWWTSDTSHVNFNLPLPQVPPHPPICSAEQVREKQIELAETKSKIAVLTNTLNDLRRAYTANKASLKSSMTNDELDSKLMSGEFPESAVSEYKKSRNLLIEYATTTSVTIRDLEQSIQDLSHRADELEADLLRVGNPDQR